MVGRGAMPSTTVKGRIMSTLCRAICRGILREIFSFQFKISPLLFIKWLESALCDNPFEVAVLLLLPLLLQSNPVNFPQLLSHSLIDVPSLSRHAAPFVPLPTILYSTIQYKYPEEIFCDRNAGS